jgi:two-component sensor histidine kinase
LRTEPGREARRIRELRERLLGKLLRITAIAGLVAYVPSAYLSVQAGVWVILIVDTVAVASLVCMAMLPRIPFGFKAAYFVALCYLLGVLLLVYTGPFGAGHLFLFAFVFLAALFGDVRALVASNVAAVLTHVGFLLSSIAGWLPWTQGPGSILVISVNSVLVSVMLSFPANYLLRGYAAAASEEERLRETLEVLLKELEHRVKNNLQVISSLIDLRARSTADPRRALDDIRESLSAVSVVHQLLYRQGTLNVLELRVLLASLVERFRNLFRGISITFQWSGPDLEIDGDRAVSLGILINEIVMNASTHAFGTRDDGVVSLRIEHEQETGLMTLAVGDNGRGIEPGADERIGMKIIRALAHQLGAKMELTTFPSVQYRFRMEIDRAGTARAAAG